MKIISNRTTKTTVRYYLSFVRDDGSGFNFDCDQFGTVLPMEDCAKENYQKCLIGIPGLVSHGVQKHEHTYRVPAIGLCDCGRKVSLGGFTNTCACGRDYNMSGQLLANRDQWGEETGETASDILNIR